MSQNDATPNRMRMDFTVVDGYLLGDAVSKTAVVEAFLSDRAPDAAAAPFYRALEAVGPRAADEAFVALRLVLAGKSPSDDQVRRLRALSAVARAARSGDRRSLAQVRKRDAAVLADLPVDGSLEDVAVAARSAYTAALGG